MQFRDCTWICSCSCSCSCFSSCSCSCSSFSFVSLYYFIVANHVVFDLNNDCIWKIWYSTIIFFSTTVQVQMSMVKLLQILLLAIPWTPLFNKFLIWVEGVGLGILWCVLYALHTTIQRELLNTYIRWVPTYYFVLVQYSKATMEKIVWIDLWYQFCMDLFWGCWWRDLACWYSPDLLQIYILWSLDSYFVHFLTGFLLMFFSLMTLIFMLKLHVLCILASVFL